MKTLEELKAELETALALITEMMETEEPTDEEVASMEEATANADGLRKSIAGLEAKEATRQEVIKTAREAAKAILAEVPASNRGGIYAPNLKKHSTTGFSNEENEVFMRYMRTGDLESVRMLKASNVNPLESVTDAQGAVTVPDDHYNNIIAKRNEMSIVRQAGATVIPTSLDIVNVPVELVGGDVFTIVAQEAAIDEDDPTFANVPITVYKFSKMTKLSVELVADEKSNLMAFLTTNVAGKMALTENQHALVGTGSSQPQGVYVGGTAGLTAASATVIAAAEVPELIHALPAQYANEANWSMANATYGQIAGLIGSQFQFTATGSGGDYSGFELFGYPVYRSEKNAALGASAKTAVFGNWEYYGLVERQGLQVQRLDELYAANGQIGFNWSYRQGGAVLQAEAFQYLTMASA